jgi:predicted pyridoxine 5'-phosphate oxidase superfamily flavin-nucleotide-binding protein
MGERIQEEIMGILTEEMRRVVTEIQLCYAATVTPDGKPNLSPKARSLC